MSELIKVYAPDGEVFENSPVNARDLVTHAGWSYSKPKLKAVEEAVKSAPKLVEVEVAPEVVELVEEVKVEVPEAAVEEVAVVEEAEVEDAEDDKEEVKTSTRGRKKKS